MCPIELRTNPHFVFFMCLKLTELCRFVTHLCNDPHTCGVSCMCDFMSFQGKWITWVLNLFSGTVGSFIQEMENQSPVFPARPCRSGILWWQVLNIKNIWCAENGVTLYKNYYVCCLKMTTWQKFKNVSWKYLLLDM